MAALYRRGRCTTEAVDEFALAALGRHQRGAGFALLRCVRGGFSANRPIVLVNEAARRVARVRGADCSVGPSTPLYAESGELCGSIRRPCQPGVRPSARRRTVPIDGRYLDHLPVQLRLSDVPVYRR